MYRVPEDVFVWKKNMFNTYVNHSSEKVEIRYILFKMLSLAFPKII